ncbi:hypothetical protein OKA05_15985 [Luteolibacter arcticus]|uniref:Uncharacterized protein n=1 Tax=Luteolibacter arcticus TaxID=1581411 RepID=A0ABT3GKL7_9BACT|nr:hypothetical protein [Luteolibacter arcticus]MCW1924068.1 hypothetical protein [Luteolibacter arcticus]
MTQTSKPTDRRARQLALASFFLVPLHIPPFMLSGSNSLTSALIGTGAVLNVALVAVAWFTGNRAPAIIALLMPFAGIALGILGFLSGFSQSW